MAEDTAKSTALPDTKELSPVASAEKTNEASDADLKKPQVTGEDAESNFVDDDPAVAPVIRNGMDVSKYIVSTRDDGDPSLTFRSIVLGSLLTIFSSVVTMLYTFKPVQVQVSAVFLQLVVWVLGVAWAKFTPNPDRFSHLPWLKKTLQFLNFGQPFGIKEHVVSALLATTGSNGLAGSEAFAVQRLYYDILPSASTVILGLFSISLVGFVLAGILRPLIVYPAEMVYWSTLPQVILFQSLHFDKAKNRDRLKKFTWALLALGVWQIFPAYIMPWLGGLTVFCLASMSAPTPTRRIFRNIFGGSSSNEGLGLFSISLDWQYISSTYVSMPIKQQLNTWIGYAIFYPTMALLYYRNAWGAKSFPFMSSALFKDNGEKYQISSILTREGIIDENKLAQVGLPNLTATSAWGFMSNAIALGALVSHVFVFLSGEMKLSWKRARSQTEPDPHYQGMLRYKEVPMWWYGVTFALCFFAGIIVTARGELTLPWWGFIVALLLGGFIGPFSCIIYGLYGDSIGTNLLSKMVGGAVHGGMPLANLYFASWSHQVVLLAVNLANWQKVGQYTKIPPKIMFITQVYGTLLGSYLNYVVMILIVNNKKDVLLDGSENQWSDAYISSLNSQAITWALARKLYNINGKYALVPIGVVIGLFLPPLHRLINRVFPATKRVPINTAIIAGWTGRYYYGSTSYVFSTVLVGLLSQLWIRPRFPRIFNKYAYIIGAAMDGGSQIVIFILSFAVFGASGDPRPFPTWFGNPDGPADHCLGVKE